MVAHFQAKVDEDAAARTLDARDGVER